MFESVTPLNVSVAGRVAGHNPYFTEATWQAANTDNTAFIDHAFQHYRKTLKENTDLWRWFSRRGILLTHELIDEFGLGFAGRNLCVDYPPSNREMGDRVRGAWQRLGLIKASGHQFFQGDVIFPFFDIDGRIVGAYGRRVTPENRKGHIYYHYWFYGDVVYFNEKAMLSYPRLVLCKTPLEALTLISLGISNVISTLGLYSFGSPHLEALQHHKVQEVVIAFDESDEGNLVAGMITQALDSIGISSYRVQLERNMDLNQYAAALNGDIDVLLERVLDPCEISSN